jgi:hypothetical protein
MNKEYRILFFNTMNQYIHSILESWKQFFKKGKEDFEK